MHTRVELVDAVAVALKQYVAFGLVVSGCPDRHNQVDNEDDRSPDCAIDGTKSPSR